MDEFEVYIGVKKAVKQLIELYSLNDLKELRVHIDTEIKYIQKMIDSQIA